MPFRGATSTYAGDRRLPTGVAAVLLLVLALLGPQSSAHAITPPAGYRACGSFHARYTIHVLAKHLSCRKARRIQKEYWLAPESEKELVGPDEYNGYIRLKRFPGWRCTSGAMAGGCRKGRREAAYSTYNGRPADGRPASSCGSYFEAGDFGQYTAPANKRISVSNRRVSCAAAMKVIREFRSFLPKRHHGAAGAAGWWTLPAAPGWRCRGEDYEGSCDRGGERAAFRVNVLSGPAHCRNEIAAGPAGGVIFLSWRHVGCGLRKRIGRSLLHGDRARRTHGFLCHGLELHAGGGGALCHRGSRFLEVGFE